MTIISIIIITITTGKTDKEKEAGLRLQEQGTLMFLKLCRDVMNLEQLIQNNTGRLTCIIGIIMIVIHYINHHDYYHHHLSSSSS